MSNQKFHGCFSLSISTNSCNLTKYSPTAVASMIWHRLVHPAALRSSIYLDEIQEKSVADCGVHIPRNELTALAQTGSSMGISELGGPKLFVFADKSAPTFQLVVIDLSVEGQLVSHCAFSL